MSTCLPAVASCSYQMLTVPPSVVSYDRLECPVLSPVVSQGTLLRWLRVIQSAVTFLHYTLFPQDCHKDCSLFPTCHKWNQARPLFCILKEKKNHNLLTHVQHTREMFWYHRATKSCPQGGWLIKPSWFQASPDSHELAWAVPSLPCGQ